MNVATAQLPASPIAGAVHATRDANSAAPADAAALFLGLLAEATALPATSAVAATGVVQPVADTAADDEPAGDEAALDWALPFLAPTCAAPVPLDLDVGVPPAGAEEGEPGLVTLQPVTDSKVTPLPALIDDPVVGKGLTTPLETESRDGAADTTGTVAATAPRVEAAANGNGQAVVVRHVTVPLNSPRWAEHVGHEIRILVEKGVQTATLKLTPEQMGPVEVRIDIVNDKATVVFGAAQADTRTALTEAIPRLREMFAGAGLTLGDAGVRHQSPGHAHGAGNGGQGGFGDDADDAIVAVTGAVRLGLVDAYA